MALPPHLAGIELFSGVGMLGEGLRAGLAHLGIPYRAVCHVEREAHAASVLAARMEDGALDAAPVWSDVTTFDARRWRGKVDCVVAGFPCQDLSVAGKRAGLDGHRSGLFFEVLRIADDCGALLVFLENVAGIATATASVVDAAEGELEERAAARVLGELADRGWNAEWLTLSAADVGASHGRARWFCLAWRQLADAMCSERRPRGICGPCGQQRDDGNGRKKDGGPRISDTALGNASGDGRRERRTELPGRPGRSDPRGSSEPVADAGCTRLQGGGLAVTRPDGKSRMDMLDWRAESFSPPAPTTPAGATSSPMPPGSPQPSPSKSSTTPRLLSRRLNPYFAEWLMGWPAGWTSTTAENASNASATALWRSALQQRLSSFFAAPESHREAA